MSPRFLAGDLGDEGAHVEMELMNSVLFMLEFEIPEERHLVGEIYAMGYKGLEIGSEDQNVYINKFKQITLEVTQQSIS